MDGVQDTAGSAQRATVEAQSAETWVLKAQASESSGQGTAMLLGAVTPKGLAFIGLEGVPRCGCAFSHCLRVTSLVPGTHSFYQGPAPKAPHLP